MLGRYKEAYEFPGERPAAFLRVRITLPDSLELAEVFSDIEGLHTIGNPVTCDEYGNLNFVAELGDYDTYPEFGGRSRITVEQGTAPGPQGPPGVIPPTVPVRLFYDPDLEEYPPRDLPEEIQSAEWVGPADKTPPEALPGYDTWIKV